MAAQDPVLKVLFGQQIGLEALHSLSLTHLPTVKFTSLPHWPFFKTWTGPVIAGVPKLSIGTSVIILSALPSLEILEEILTPRLKTTEALVPLGPKFSPHKLTLSPIWPRVGSILQILVFKLDVD